MEADRASRALTKSSTAGNSFVLEAHGALVALLETKLTSTALHFSVLSPSVLKYLPALYPSGTACQQSPAPRAKGVRGAGEGKRTPFISALPWNAARTERPQRTRQLPSVAPRGTRQQGLFSSAATLRLQPLFSLPTNLHFHSNTGTV